jgi:FixJ family two-component response regulator
VTALPHVLLVDEDIAIYKAVEFRLRGNARLISCHSGTEALARVRLDQFDVALVDMFLGEGLSGSQLVSRLREADPDLAAIIFTAHSDYETAVESLGAHSFDFIPKSLNDDRIFRTKIDQAVVRTREQRTRSQGAVDALRLRAALSDAVVNNELEVTNGDIQRGLLSESLNSFSALLGRVELMNLHLEKRCAHTRDLDDVVKLSQETVAELQDYVEKLRDYFAEPERATNSVNEVLRHAVGVVQDEAAGLGHTGIQRGELHPDLAFTGDGRALLRAVVILLRMVVKAAPDEASFAVTPSLLFNPRAELNELRARHQVRILHTPNFRKDDKAAVEIEISGPGGDLTADQIASLFTLADHTRSDASPWSAVAMVAKLEGALVVESKPGARICYRIILRV